MNKYLQRLSIFIVIAFLPFAAILLFFQSKGYQPILTDSISFDIKINEALAREMDQVDVLAMGSSICLNDLHSPTIQTHIGEQLSYYNFSSWGVTIDQSLTVLNVLLDRYHPKVVLMVSTSTDFESPKMNLCSEQELKWYLNTPTKPYFFLKELDFFNLTRRYQNTRELIHHDNIKSATAFNMDEWGGVNLKVPAENRVQHRWDDETLSVVDEQQYGYLEELALTLQKRGVRFVFIQPPMKYGNCQTEYCQEGVKRHIERTQDILESTGQVYLNLYTNNPYPDSLFSDELHLNFEGPQRFTQQVIEAIDVKQIVLEMEKTQATQFTTHTP